jgi:chromosome segregation ATPase
VSGMGLESEIFECRTARREVEDLLQAGKIRGGKAAIEALLSACEELEDRADDVAWEADSTEQRLGDVEEQKDQAEDMAATGSEAVEALRVIREAAQPFLPCCLPRLERPLHLANDLQSYFQGRAA